MDWRSWDAAGFVCVPLHEDYRPAIQWRRLAQTPPARAMDLHPRFAVRTTSDAAGEPGSSTKFRQ